MPCLYHVIKFPGHVTRPRDVAITWLPRVSLMACIDERKKPVTQLNKDLSARNDNEEVCLE